MPDSSSSTSSSSSSGDSPQEQSTFNQAQLEDLGLAERIVAESRAEPYRTELAADADIPQSQIEALAAECLSARQRTAQAIIDETSGENQTLQAAGVERQIVLLIQRIQSAARQKYARTTPVQLQNYFIGERINPNEETLHQVAFNICELLTPPTGTDLATARDALPGIRLSEHINPLRALISLPPAPLGSSSSSSSSSSGAGIVPPNAPADRAERDRIIKVINDKRMAIQFAIDGLHPYTDRDRPEPGVAAATVAAREAYDLPRNRPFTG